MKNKFTLSLIILGIILSCMILLIPISKANDYEYYTTIIRPNLDSAPLQCLYYRPIPPPPPLLHCSVIDEISPNEDLDYIYTPNSISAYLDTWDLQNCTDGSGDKPDIKR